MNTEFADMEKYAQSCKSDFWQEVFKVELDYLLQYLKGAADVLSIGCGPAIIETGLAEHGFNVTGLDISQEALNLAPDIIRKVAGSAEQTNFADCSFDAVIYVASLQFIDNYKKAIKETCRVLKSQGKLIVMLLNPQSEFFQEKLQNPDSFVNSIKNINLKEIEEVVGELFSIKTEYLLGIRDKSIFKCRDSNLAALYVIKGTIKNQIS